MLDFNFSKSNLIEECTDGFYSSSCTEVCGQCINGLSCNKDTGHCKTCSNNFIHPFCKGTLLKFCCSLRSRVIVDMQRWILRQQW